MPHAWPGQAADADSPWLQAILQPQRQAQQLAISDAGRNVKCLESLTLAVQQAPR
jgi:hypothetical protein